LIFEVLNALDLLSSPCGDGLALLDKVLENCSMIGFHQTCPRRSNGIKQNRDNLKIFILFSLASIWGQIFINN
jgi:hypothetical protein